MVSADILKKIREIEIQTRRILAGGLVGENQSAVKGSGFDFDQIRDYQVGDDIRFIDWKSSARTNTILVKQYIEERSRNIMVALDVSSSTMFTSGEQRKLDCMTEIATIFAFAATYSKDSVGALLFSDDVELFVPFGKGMSHTHNLLERMCTHKQKGSRTAVAKACQRIASLPTKNAIVLVVSDFIDDRMDVDLRIAAKKHDVIAVRCLDRNERALPPVGFLTVCDSETGSEHLVHTNSSTNSSLTDRLERQTLFMKQSGIDILDIDIERPYIADIVRFFKKRMVY